MIPPELLAAITASPDDPAPRAVAADDLQERGDPLGELIALSIADPEKHAARIAELENALVPFDWTSGWIRGWRWGFLEQLSCIDVVAGSLQRLPEVLAQPAARLLRALVFEGAFVSPFQGGLDATLAATPPELRVLVVWSTAGWYPTSIALDAARCPHLTTLALRARGLRDPLVLPELVELGLELDDFDDAFVGAELPKLHTLRLVLPARAPMVELAAALARFPALHHLAIAMPFPDAAIVTLPVASLEVIDTVGYERGRRRFLREVAPNVPVAGLVELGRAGHFTALDPRAASRIETVTIEWSGVDWWLRDGRAHVNRLALDHVPLRDGDELQIDTHTYRFVTGDDLDAKVAAWRIRYGLRG